MLLILLYLIYKKNDSLIEKKLLKVLQFQNKNNLKIEFFLSYIYLIYTV